MTSREAFGAVAVDCAGGADAVGAEEGGQARDGRREAVGRKGGGTEKRELRAAGLVRMRGEGEAADGRAGRAGLELQAHERQESLDLARRRGERDRARVAAVRVELQRGLELHAGEALGFQALDETLQGRVAEKEEGLERDERPFEVHAFEKVGGGRRGSNGRGSIPRAAAWNSRPSSPRRLATSPSGRRANSPIERMPQRSSISAISIAGARRERGSGARKRCSSPAGTTVGESGRPAATRAASLEAAMPTFSGKEAFSAAAMMSRPRAWRGEFWILDWGGADPCGGSSGTAGVSAGKRVLGISSPSPVPLPGERGKADDLSGLTSTSTSFQIQVDEAFAGVFDSRRKRIGDFEEGFLRGALAFAVAGPGEELGEEGAGLGERHAVLEAFFARLARGGDDPGGVAVAFEDGDGFAFQVRLAAQARGEREEGDVEAGEHLEN